MRRWIALVTIAIGPVACDSPTDLRSALPSVRIDNLNYELRPTSAGLEGEIPFSITNPLTDTIYFASLAGGLYRREGDTWVLAWSMGRLDVVRPALAIPPGSTYSGSIGVFAAYRTTNSYPQFAFDSIDGEYRWEFSDVYSKDPSVFAAAQQLPRALRVSNRFTLSEKDINETDCARHYSYYELGLWDRLSGYLWVPGVRAYDFEESRLCLAFGIKRNDVLPTLEANLRQRNVPRDAVRVYVDRTVILWTHTGTGMGT